MYTKDRSLYVINKTVPLDHPFCENCVIEQEKLASKELDHKARLTGVTQIEPGIEHKKT